MAPSQDPVLRKSSWQRVTEGARKRFLGVESRRDAMTRDCGMISLLGEGQELALPGRKDMVGLAG
jgi:hypothetical protein